MSIKERYNDYIAEGKTDNITEQIVFRLFYDLSDRSDFWWEGLRDDTIEAWMNEWADIVAKILAARKIN